jgi:hypothetical protein
LGWQIAYIFYTQKYRTSPPYDHCLPRSAEWLFGSLVDALWSWRLFPLILVWLLVSRHMILERF